MKLQESIMSDLDALAREHSELGLFICDALNEDDFNLEKDKDTIEFLIDVFENAHKDLDMAPMQVTEKKATYCGRCGHTHVKGTPCPRPFKEGLSTYGDDAYFVVPNKRKMKKEDILKAVKEVLTEGQLKTYAITPQNKAEAEKELRSKGYKGPVEPNTSVTAEDHNLDPDDESSMAKSQLYHIASYAIELMKMIQDGEQLDAWVQSKITKAADYIDSVKHYMEGEKALSMSEGGSDGDFEDQEKNKQMAYHYYDKGQEAYSKALHYGSYLGWTDKELPPYKPVNEKLDPVGHEDKDIDNDGDVDKTDKYLKNKRVKIGKAIASHKK